MHAFAGSSLWYMLLKRLPEACAGGRDAAVLRAEAEGLADVLGAAGADAAAETAARAQLDAQLAQAQRRLAKVRAGSEKTKQMCSYVKLRIGVQAHTAVLPVFDEEEVGPLVTDNVRMMFNLI